MYTRVFDALNYRKMLNWLPDKVFLKVAFRARFGKKLNLKKPETFNEKIYNKIISMTPKQQQTLFEKTLQNYPDKNAFSYKLLISKTYEEIINHPGLINFYIKTLKEQKFVDILMDQF